VISGFNTDIEFNGVVYHVQTEDKGVETPLILSLVYTGGEILASKRSTYEDLVAAGFDENVLADRLGRQHKLMCAAIVAGRIEDLRRMSEKEITARASSRTAEKQKVETIQIEPEIVHETRKESVATGYETRPLKPFTQPQEVNKLEEDDFELDIPTEENKTTFNTVTVPITNIVREVVTDFSQEDVADNHEFNIKVLEEKPLRGGDRVMLRILVSHGDTEEDGISGAEVMVKVMGSTFRPLLFQSRTGPNGIATIRMQLPHFTTGRAAILIRAIVEGNESELRRIVHQG